VSLYAPETSNINDPDVLTGTNVSAALMSRDSDVLVFSIRNILSTLLAKGSEDNALVLRYLSEGSSIRRAEFYTSSAPDSLKPSFTFTYSTAPSFAK
jgi:hypothetical protein